MKDRYLGFGSDPIGNINCLTAVVVEVRGVTCGLSNRLGGGLLYSWGRRNAPPDFNLWLAKCGGSVNTGLSVPI